MTLLSLTLCAGCMTQPAVVVKSRTIKLEIPAALLAPTCPKVWVKDGGPATTGDFVKRGDVNEAGVKCREAKLAGIRKWQKGEKAK